jgi:hypothetical protein
MAIFSLEKIVVTINSSNNRDALIIYTPVIVKKTGYKIYINVREQIEVGILE